MIPHKSWVLSITSEFKISDLNSCMSNYPNAHAKVKKLISDVQFPGSSWVSLKIIFEAPQSELFRFKFNSIPEFNLHITTYHVSDRI